MPPLAPLEAKPQEQPVFKDAAYSFCATDSSGCSGNLKIKLDGSSTMKLKHSWSRQKGQFMGLELSTAKWGFEAQSNNDIALERRFKANIGELRVKQRIPAGKQWLIPSPEVKLVASPLDISKWKLKDELELGYDFQKSVGKVTEEIVFDKRFKAKFTADTMKGFHGATVGLTAKLQKPLIYSLGLDISCLAGPVLKYEVNFGAEELVKAKADWKLDSNEARLELQPKISQQARLTITAIGKPDGGKPRILLGTKCEM